MRMTFALPLLALAGCQTIVPAPDQGAYRAIGTEPFWDLTIGRDLIFTDRGNDLRVAEPTPPVRREVAGERYVGRRLSLTIAYARCSDGMSERIYPDSVTVSLDGRLFKGCGANSAFYARVGEDGRERPQGQPDLTSIIVGRWIAASFNGQLAALGDRFALVVTPTEVRTDGVCNNLHGHYRIAAGKLSPAGPPWPRSERGCDPDRMVREDRVFAVMWYAPAVSFPTPDRLRLTSARGMLEFDRAR